jgi:gamma-glutamyl phosphate reductase
MKHYLFLFVLLFTIQSIVQPTILSKASLNIVTEENSEDQSSINKNSDYVLFIIETSCTKLQNTIIQNINIPILITKAKISPTMIVETPPPNMVS